jgi:uncharacterized protein YqeY
MQYSELKSLIVQTMKAKEEKKLLALRSLDSSVKNVAISNGRKDPTEEDLVVAIRKSVKQCSDSYDQFVLANRLDLAENEKFQVDLYSSFLPKQLTAEELDDKISQIIDNYVITNGSASQKDFGKLMKISISEINGLSDSKSIQAKLKEILEKL